MEPRFTSRASSMQVRRPSPRHRTTTIQSGATGGRVSVVLDYSFINDKSLGQFARLYEGFASDAWSTAGLELYCRK